MSLFLIAMGSMAALVGWVWIMIIAFSDSVPWGVGIFFCGLVGVVYGILKWDEAKFPTILLGVGTILHVLGRIIAVV